MSRKTVCIFILLISVALFGCTNVSISGLDSQVNPDDPSLKLIEEKREVDIYSIDCDSINSKPELWYIKSGNSIGYYSYIPPKEVNHPKYNIGYEKLEIENRKLSNNESIRPNAYCSFGGGLNQNVNYLYCKKDSFRHKEYSEDGTILSLGFVTIKPIFQVDKTEERPDTNGEYAIVEDSKLISQECTISFAK